jgi:hypothetical protein
LFESFTKNKDFEMNAGRFLRDLEERLKDVDGASLSIKFAFPFLQICVTHPQFAEKCDEDREQYVADLFGLGVSDIRRIASAAMMHFHWISPGESPWIPEKGDHWIFGDTGSRNDHPTELEGPRVRHFFGYKGGQARTTVLAVLARSLAERGQKVLLIDADLEAPSLPVILGKKPRVAASTLLGLYRNAEAIPQPLSCIVTARGGSVELLASRLADPDEDIEYDAFLLKSLLDPSVPIGLGERIINYTTAHGYHAIFVDQRTGSSPATLNWFDALPGGVCFFAKLDEQWESGERLYKILIDRAKSVATAMVSFKPDEENPETYISRNSKQIRELSKLFELALLSKLPDPDKSDDIDPADGIADRDRWLMWPYDQAFRTSRFPAFHDLGQRTKEATIQLAELLELLDFPTRTQITPHQVTYPAHSSGFLDSDILIHTPILRDLKVKDSAITYVFGRKGTGKSRLFRALADEGLGIPLIADTEFQGHGLRSADIKEILETSSPSVSPTGLWWKLLVIAVSGEIDQKVIKERLSDGSPATSDDLRLALKASKERKTFLIDGLETAFRYDHLKNYIDGLFEVMRLLQNDSEFRERVEVRLFLRTDLKDQANAPNLEQQIDGRARSLRWDLQGILNFMLSRIASPRYSFFRQHFPNTVNQIEARKELLSAASLNVDDAFSLLLPIFPERVRRVNAHMRTFIILHFSDDAGVAGNYYPRFVIDFLEAIDHAGDVGYSYGLSGGSKLEDSRISSNVVQHAFDEAAKKFLFAVKTELQTVVELSPEQLDSFLGAFDGLSTPFSRDVIADSLHKKTKLPIETIRATLAKCKNLGFFEDRPGFGGAEWRAGRIYRSALKMKLSRR